MVEKSCPWEETREGGCATCGQNLGANINNQHARDRTGDKRKVFNVSTWKVLVSRIQRTLSTSSSFARPGNRLANILHEEHVIEVEIYENLPV